MKTFLCTFLDLILQKYQISIVVIAMPTMILIDVDLFFFVSMYTSTLLLCYMLFQFDLFFLLVMLA